MVSSDDDIVIRMTGCPNGCARPYLAEIGLVGKGPGRYNLYLGAAFDGSRLSKLYAEDLEHAGIIARARSIFAAYAAEREAGEHFGDFVIRAGFVARTGNGSRLPLQCRGDAGCAPPVSYLRAFASASSFSADRPGLGAPITAS